MAYNSNGASQYLVLDSLSNGSKYGLEIIEYISKKTGGHYIMKKPTLYSCLTRMEKKGLVSSSYWGESELGGKRHYYSITTAGRRSLEELSVEFSDFSFDDEVESPSDAIFLEPEEKLPEIEESKPVFLHQDNIFNLVKEEEKKETPSTLKEEKKSEIVDNQIDFFTFQEEIQKQEEQIQPEQSQEEQEKIEYYQSILEQTPPKDDAKFLDESEKLTADQEEQNKRIYDTLSDLKRYRKRKSFSENQIEMSVVYENDEDQEIQRARIEELKASMLNARQNQYETIQQPTQTETVLSNPQFEETADNASDEEIMDDAVFITSRIQTNEIPVQKKITPPNIEIDATTDNLPAPKRNSNLEPTYKDMMSKLFERKKEKKAQQVVATPQPQEITENYEEMGTFADYDSLKRYYNGHGIEFKEYNKSSVEKHHNTYFLNFISSIILLALSGIGCAVLFGIFHGTKMLNVSTNFMFYTVPILFFIYTLYTFIRDRVYISKKAVLKHNALTNWIIFLLASIVIVVINIIAGMRYESMSTYLTSFIIPILAVLIAFPINYYIKKIIYRKYAK